MTPIIANARLVVSVAEAAAMLNLSRTTIRTNIKAGKLKVVRIGRRVLVPISAINEFLSQHLEVNPSPQETSNVQQDSTQKIQMPSLRNAG